MPRRDYHIIPGIPVSSATILQLIEPVNATQPFHLWKGLTMIEPWLIVARLRLSSSLVRYLLLVVASSLYCPSFPRTRISPNDHQFFILSYALFIIHTIPYHMVPYICTMGRGGGGNSSPIMPLLKIGDDDFSS